jgi:hypothetical protein
VNTIEPLTDAHLSAVTVLRALDEELWFSALHEAGHVVVACRLRVPFVSVTIVPDEDSRGRMRHPDGYSRRLIEMTQTANPGSPEWKRLENSLVVSLAGCAATTVAGRPDYAGSEQDFAAVSECLVHMGIMDQVDKTAKLQARAEKLVRAEWSTVERVARLLVDKRTITRREAGMAANAEKEKP